MISIELNNCGKSYNRKWLFKNLDLQLNQGEKWAFLGPNGSGKSTLALMLCAQVWPTQGSIAWKFDSNPISAEKVFAHVALASPAMELPGEYSLIDIIHSHGLSKPFTSHEALDQIMALCGFDLKTAQKPLITFSSGMLQRVKLSLAAFSNVPILILDEPLSNLDKAGSKVYQTILEEYCQNRMLIVASNREDEYEFCDFRLEITSGGSISLNQ